MSNSVSYRLEQYFTVEQTANCLQVPEDYVISLLNSGIVESIILPGNLDHPERISGDSFESFIRSCRSEKQTPALRQISVPSAEQDNPQNDCNQKPPQQNSQQQCSRNQHPDSDENKTCLSVFEV